MENYKYIASGDSYLDIKGGVKEVLLFTYVILNGKLKMLITTKSPPKTPVQLTKKNLKKYLKYTLS